MVVLLGFVLALIGPAPEASAAVPTPRPAPGGQSSGSGTGSTSNAPPAAQSTGSAKSVISGAVLLDEDVSGGASSGDRPVIGIAVRIVGPGVNAGATTGGGGAFSFSGLPAGSYTITIAPPSGVVALNGTSRTVAVDGRNGGRAEFYVARPERAPTATPLPPPPTPLPPTPTPRPTSTPRPLPNVSAAPGYLPPEPPPGAPGSAAGPTANRRSPAPGSNATTPNLMASQGTRYAPGRANLSSIQPVRDGNTFWLGVPFISQLDGSTYGAVNCGPASTAMVLGAFGIRTTPPAIRNYVNSITGMYSADIGTGLDSLSRIVRESGLEVTSLYGPAGGYRRWSTELVREEVRAGRPVMTLVKYRALPTFRGAQTDFDHYIVIAGLAGDDFIYNDGIFTSADRGYGLLISPSDLERAWDYSSIPRHGMAVSLSGSPQERTALLAPDEPDAEEDLQLGVELTDEDLVGEALSEGARLSIRGAFGGLTFKRMQVGGEAEPASEPTPELAVGAVASLDLADFVSLEPAASTAEASTPAASAQARSLAAVMVTSPPRAADLAFLPPLAGLGGLFALAFFGITGRRLR